MRASSCDQSIVQELCQKFEVGFNAIQTMYMPAYEREPLDSNVKSEEETSMNSSALDLEFPPLLAALEPNPTGTIIP